MKELLLELLLTIKGIGAASGLVVIENELKVISDDSNFLYSYNISTQKLHKTPLLTAVINENIPKADKADFESIVEIEGLLYIFGSGSSAKRNTLIKHNPTNHNSEQINLAAVYQEMQKTFDISESNFNIEGAVHIANNIFLFNRGNGPAQKNGIFTLDKETLKPLSYTPVDLPLINGVVAGFTDAVYVDGDIFFIAAAEDVASTYLDGEVKGSIIGRLDPVSFKVKSTALLSQKHKLEGIAVLEKTAQQITFVLCEDSDDNLNESAIYKLNLVL